MPIYSESETATIYRSKINFAPYNPKKHSKEHINQIKKNIKKVGFLGGIIFNEVTGNLIDGHKRVMTLDLINGYDGTQKKDYQIKVELVRFDEKTEKEQNVFQSTSRTEIDKHLLVEIIEDISIEDAGLTIEDVEILQVEVPSFKFDFGKNEDAKNDFNSFKEQSNEEKQANIQKIKEAKQASKNKHEGANYVTITFDNFDNKAYFMERFGFDHYDLYIKGELFEKRIERIE